MGILNQKEIKKSIIILAIFICITFFFYRIVDISMNQDYMFNQYQGFLHNHMTNSTLGMNNYLSIDHTIVNETQTTFIVDVSLIFDKYYGEDKGSIFNLIILLATYLMIHLIFIQLFFLYVRRWLIKTNNILERYTLLIINYVHMKDGKKRYYPSYVHC